MEHNELILFSKFELDSQKGAGLRVVQLFLKAANQETKSMYWSGEKLHNPNSTLLPKNIFSFWVKCLKLTKSNSKILILPDSINDCLLCFALVLFRRKSIVWIMDDFWSLEISDSFSIKNTIKKTFSKIFMGLVNNLIVISDAMSEEFQKRFNFKKIEVIPPVKPVNHKLNQENTNKLSSWVYMGNIKEFYNEPLLKMPIDVLVKNNIKIDIYSSQQPSNDLNNKVFQYKGTFPESKKEEILSQYSVALLSYSFDENTKKLFELSFPSKLMDYIQAQLITVCIAPENLFGTNFVLNNKIGPVVSEIDDNSYSQKLSQCIDKLNSYRNEYSENITKISQEYSFEVFQNKFQKFLE